MNEIIEKVVGLMRDTDDPVDGAVFEKKADVDFPTFCTFVLTQWDNVTMEKHKDGNSTVFLFYNGPKATDHVASYINNHSIYKMPHGVFGGIRIGSLNTAYNNIGAAFVKNPFEIRRSV